MSAETSRLKTILVVEDDAFVREVACEILRSAGYAVLSASNATEAQNVFSACGEEIALLLTDIVLPGQNGHVLAERLKQNRPSLKVLFATGYPEQMSRGLDCLAKPFSAATLLDSVAGMLEHAPTEFSRDIMIMPACGNTPRPECV